MLIKLVKLLGSLLPAEPRLAKKLQDPLTHIIANTPAKSLLYECINTATNCDNVPKSMVRLCLDKLRTFVEDPDQNLKYLGLLGLNKIMKTNMKAVSQHRDLILQCLEDPDITIRMRALDLITSMVTEKNLEQIIQKLSDHLYNADGNYREHVLEQIIKVCSKSDYEYIQDFAWYVQLLTNMTQLSSMNKNNAELISSQLMDVSIRVPEVRKFTVEQMEGLIVNNGLIGDLHNMSSNAICRVLKAAAYIVGEFSNYVIGHLTLVKAMLQDRISSLPSDIQCIFIHNSLKVVCSGLKKYGIPSSSEINNETNVQKCNDLLSGTIKLLEPLSSSHYIEVQERATCYLYFVVWLKLQYDENNTLLNDIIIYFSLMFNQELNPVHPKSQEIVVKKQSEMLHLDEWIGQSWPDSDHDSDKDSDAEGDDNDWFGTSSLNGINSHGLNSNEEKYNIKELTEDEKKIKTS